MNFKSIFNFLNMTKENPNNQQNQTSKPSDGCESQGGLGRIQPPHEATADFGPGGSQGAAPQISPPAGRGQGVGDVPDDAQTKLTDALAQMESFKANYLRAAADLENQKKRHARERDEFLRYGNAALIASILPVVDNFEIALKAAEEHHPEAKSLLEGLGMIIPQLLQTLKMAGVETIAPKSGDAFDPNFHQSVGEAASEKIPPHAVLELQRPGYKLHDRLLRPAMVMLSKGKEEKK
jgi:molecular chaperone GrpE